MRGGPTGPETCVTTGPLHTMGGIPPEQRSPSQNRSKPTLHLSRAESSATNYLRSNLSHSSDQASMRSAICL
jgi:hypothetical protein